MRHAPYPVRVLAAAFALGAILHDAAAGAAGSQGAESADQILARVIQSGKPTHGFSPSWYNPPVVRKGGEFQAHNYVPRVALWERGATRQILENTDVSALIGMGPEVAPLVNQSLETMAPERPAAAHLALVLREVGTRESVPVLIELLWRATEPSQDHRETSARQPAVKAAVSALWKLTGRQFALSPADWRTWWTHVGGRFLPARDRATRQVEPAEVERLVAELAQEAPPAQAGFIAIGPREQLIALGPNAVPHLLKALPAADHPLQLRLAEVTDELGGARQLPRELRMTYFIQRLVTLDLSSVEGKHVATRSLVHQDLASFCEMAIEVDRRKGNTSARMMWGWIKGSSLEFRQSLGNPDYARRRKMERTIPRVPDPEQEVVNAVPVLIAGLSEPDKASRRVAVEIAGVIGMVTPYTPGDLIDALHRRWLAEDDSWMSSETAVAFSRYRVPEVDQGIMEALASEDERVLGDSAFVAGLNSSRFRDAQANREMHDRLVELTQHNNDRVRYQSVRTLRSVAPVRLRPHLARLCGDPKASIRRELAITIGKLKDPASTKLLVQLLQDEDERVRQWVWSAMADPAYRGAIPDLVPYLKDKRRRSSVLRTIVQAGGTSALPILMNELRQDNDLDRVVHHYLRQLTGEDFETREEWLAWWKKNRPVQ